MPGSLPTSLWTSLAIAGVIAHAVLFGALHSLEPQLNPRSAILSDYHQTGSAWVVTVAFLAFASIWFSLSIALAGPSPRSLVLTAGRILFFLAAIGIVTGAIMPETADPRTSSIVARLQNLIARPGLFLAIILVSVGLRRASGWTNLWPRLLALALIATAMLPATVGVLLDHGYAGIGQRSIFVLLYVWVGLVALRLARPRSGLEVGSCGRESKRGAA